MRVLGIDTSSSLGSVALVDVGTTLGSVEILASATARVSNAHGESLLPLVEGVLRAAGAKLEEIELFAVGIGPGSFTGTRIGVATAKGLALGAKRPLRGVDAFAAIAIDTHATDDDPITIAIDARKSEVYLAVVRLLAHDVEVVVPPAHLPPAAVWSHLVTAAASSNDLPPMSAPAPAAPESPFPPRIVAGDGVGLVAELAPLARRRVGRESPSAIAVAALAGVRQSRAAADEVDVLEPLYVRPPDITVPKVAIVPA